MTVLILILLTLTILALLVSLREVYAWYRIHFTNRRVLNDRRWHNLRFEWLERRMAQRRRK